MDVGVVILFNKTLQRMLKKRRTRLIKCSAGHFEQVNQQPSETEIENQPSQLVYRHY